MGKSKHNIFLKGNNIFVNLNAEDFTYIKSFDNYSARNSLFFNENLFIKGYDSCCITRGDQDNVIVTFVCMIKEDWIKLRKGEL